MNVLPPSKKLVELAQIMKLRTMKAQRAYSEKQEQCREFKRIADEQQAVVDALQDGLDKVARYKEEQKKIASPVIMQETSDRRHWLIYDQDLEQYNLDIAIGDLDDATAELNALKTAWLQAQQRESNIVEKSELSVLAESEEEEAMQESEIEDLQLKGGGIDG